MRTVCRTRHIIGVLLALCLTTAVIPVHAVQTGDWLIRGGLGHVAPTGESVTVPVVGGKLEADDSTNLAVNFTYMLSDNLGVELLGALPFKHDLMHNTLGKVGETKELPPTLILLYNFAPRSGVRPYAGIGLNYTTFFSEKTTGPWPAPRSSWTIPSASRSRPVWTLTSTRTGSSTPRCGAWTLTPRRTRPCSASSTWPLIPGPCSSAWVSGSRRYFPATVSDADGRHRA